MPNLWMRTLRLREGKQLIQGHTELVDFAGSLEMRGAQPGLKMEKCRQEKYLRDQGIC